MNEQKKQAFIERITKSNNYQELLEIALEIIEMNEGKTAIVCGPISSGGFGSIEKNIEAMNLEISKLVEQGHKLFDQTIFEERMEELRNEYSESREESNLHLLENFHRPLFESGIVEKLFFMKGWQSSQGATWEHETAKEIGIEIIYLD